MANTVKVGLIQLANKIDGTYLGKYRKNHIPQVARKSGRIAR